MHIRLFAILMLLLPAFQSLDGFVQQLGVGTSTQMNAQTDSCEMPSCCQVVETVTCCGLVSTEAVCAKSGGVCQCAASPADLPTPKPTPALPISLGELILDESVAHELIFVALVEDQSHPLMVAPRQDHSPRSHAVAQALLGVWRI